jgi:branched-subunit amino acid ABC-type transport system permease component
VYGATSAAIALTFFAGIVVLQALLRPLTSGSELAVAASTLASFALFQPIRRRVQDAVDRRFYRSRYDAVRTLDSFAVRLRDEVDLDAVRADLLGSVQQTVAPAHMSLWLRIRP